jgi:multidrug efflux pump subunit AcrA (membrane-fusion protein)
MKKTVALIVTFLILGILVFVFFQKIQVKMKQDKQRSMKIVYNVGTIEAKKTTLKETIKTQALVQGNPQIKVLSIDTGIFIKNNVKEGDYVTKDEDIAFIDRNVPGSNYLPTPIKSPINGVITKLYNIDAGSSISLQSPIAEVANLNSVKIVVNLGEEDLLKMKDGQPVTITSDYSKNINIQTKLNSVTPVIDSDSLTGTATIFMDNSNHRLKIGLSVNVEIQTDQREAFMIPESAVLMGQDKTYIYLDDNNVARELAIQTGFSKDGLIEITGNIKEGDIIITDGNFKLFNGSAIKVLSDNSGDSTKKGYGPDKQDQSKSQRQNGKQNPNYKKKTGQ